MNDLAIQKILGKWRERELERERDNLNAERDGLLEELRRTIRALPEEKRKLPQVQDVIREYGLDQPEREG